MSAAMSTVNSKRKLCALQELPLTWDIWVNHILPFVGMGHYAFVASVNHHLNDMYKAFCDTVKSCPLVWVKAKCVNRTRDAFRTDTFYQSAVFSSVTCAEYWFNQSQNMLNCLTDYCALISQTGNPEILQWAQQKNLPCNSRTCAEIAKHGHLSLLKYAHENVTYRYTSAKRTFKCSLESHVLECRWEKKATYHHENECLWDEDTCRSAAVNGHIECLQYAHENGCRWNKDTCAQAAKGGHIKCLKYAHENGCPWDVFTCYLAARFGHLECLQYAHENECPWDKMSCTRAAANGQLECLQYAHEHGCPWDRETCIQASRYGHVECLMYAHFNGCDSRHVFLHVKALLPVFEQMDARRHTSS